MNHRPSRSDRSLAPVLLAALIGGCAAPLESPTKPLISSDHAVPVASAVASAGGMGRGFSGQFYPLRIGNRWSYRKQIVYTTVAEERDPWLPTEWNGTIDRELICVESRDGRDYLVEQVEQIEEQYPDQMSLSWIRYRQDRAGLYEADLSLLEPALCGPSQATTSRKHAAAGERASRLEVPVPSGTPERQAAFRAAIDGLQAKLTRVDEMLRRVGSNEGGALAAPGELTRLRYPLYPTATWTIRSDPTFVARVEGTDILDLPAGHLPGFRIRMLSAFFNPNDVVRVWYGPAGFLQLVAHVELYARDASGNIIGRVIGDQRETLVSVSLVKDPFSRVLFEERLPWSR